MIVLRLSAFSLFAAFLLLQYCSTDAAAQTCDVNADLMPTENLRTYIPKPGVSTPLPGNLELSSTMARYEMLQGEMQLEYVGQMPQDGGGETDGAAVYRIRNAEAFSGLGNNNRWTRKGLVLWLTVMNRATSVRVGWLDIEDWSKYRPDILGLRLAQTYCLPATSPASF